MDSVGRHLKPLSGHLSLSVSSGASVIVGTMAEKSQRLVWKDEDTPHCIHSHRTAMNQRYTDDEKAFFVPSCCSCSYPRQGLKPSSALLDAIDGWTGQIKVD